MKKYLFFATALAALASCSSNDFVGDQQLISDNDGAISFNLSLPAVTRSEKTGSAAATDLGNQFIVWGEKNSGNSDTKDAPAAGHIVFPNYQVNYAENTAYTTTSNTKNWEYVGYTHSTNYQSNITYKASATAAISGSTAAQTIKYWDYSAGSYTFTAVSASKLNNSKTDIENGYIKIQKNIDDNDKASEKGYTITVTANADLTKLYLSDRTVITKTNGTNREGVNAYGGNVTLKFRNALSQIRAGIYETISGYAISDIKFYVNTSGSSPTQTQLAQASSVDAFGAICPNIKGTGYAGTLTVTYSEETNTSNHPIVSASAGENVNDNLILGTNISNVTTAAPLGTTATAPTWDTSGGTFTTVLLNGAHTTNLQLKCDYTLYNSVSGETIVVEGATAVVPYEYLQWKPNYKYTYLFKISDNTNGSTGEGVLGLYPITFDAVEVVAEDGVAEYITTVSEPSITTFGVKNDKYTTGKNEYELGTKIYITIVENNAVVNPTFMGNVHLYKVTSSDETNFPVTEASVAEAQAETSTGTNKITCTHVCTTLSPNNAAKTTTVPAEDGTTKNVNAVWFIPTEIGYYAIRYTPATGAVYDTGTVLAQNTSLEGYYTLVNTVYTPCADNAVADGTTTYYKRTSEGKPVYKIVKVVTGS